MNASGFEAVYTGCFKAFKPLSNLIMPNTIFSLDSPRCPATLTNQTNIE